LPAPSEQSGESIDGPWRSKLYGRRKGPKISAHQSSLVETLLPRLNFRLREKAHPAGYFDNDIEDVWLEIGFGAGEHLLWQAAHHPHVGLIGAEPYEAGVAKLLSKLDALSSARGSGDGDKPEPLPPPDCPGLRGRGGLLPNIRIYQGDARDVIEALPDASLGRVFLLFPDPWPKRRHLKRRFIQIRALNALARVMKAGAEFRFASDDAGYVAWALEHVLAHECFAWMAERPRDWLTRPNDWPITRYEQKALHGTPSFLGFVRGPIAAPLQTAVVRRK
jgi:tRNA (guanine-N7-)-methyltransferase